MAKLASIRVVRLIEPIEGADLIEKVWVDGWSLVVKKGEFDVGDVGLYMEVDTCIPLNRESFAFLQPRGSKLIGNEYYHRLKTIKLKNTLSQGLLLPLDVLGAENIPFTYSDFDKDFGEELGLFRYDPDIHGPVVSIPAQAAGRFPDYIPKTDQERCLDGNTIILTPDGPMKLVDMVHQQYRGQVLCVDEHNQICIDNVINTVEKHDDIWLTIEMENGVTITTTIDHPIFVPSLNAYREARQLLIGDEILTVFCSDN